jgi:hypothetical protein
LILGALSLAGCGDTVIDASKAEDAIQTNLERSRHEKVTSVVCPSGQKVEVGDEFTCTIDLSNGKHAIVTLKIRNKEADTDVVGFKQTK